MLLATCDTRDTARQRSEASSAWHTQKRKGQITLAIADWIAIVIGDSRLLSNQSEQSSYRL